MNRDGLPNNLSECFGKIEKPLVSSYPENTLSVCMIVKDEESNIKAAITDFSRFADEICIVDTGSTDSTIGYINEMDARTIDYINSKEVRPTIELISIPWKDDFSHARNESLKLATSRWVIWMDADDRVSPEEAEKFNHLKQSPLDRMFSFQCINTQKGHKPIGSRFTQIRMFPNTDKIYFEKAVHEQIVYSAARLGLHVVHSDAIILHTGYESDELKKAKSRRNLKLYSKEKDIDTDPTLKFCLGDTYQILEDWDKSLKTYLEINEIPDCKELQVQIWECLPERIGSSYHELNQNDKAVEWYKIGIERNKDVVENYFFLAEVYFETNSMNSAIENYIKTINCKKIISSCSSHYDNMQLLAFQNLLRIFIILEKQSDCIRLIEFMTKKYPTHRIIYDKWQDRHAAFETSFCYTS